MNLTEKQFSAQVVDLAHLRGWKVYHSWTSIHSPRGFPDLFCVRPPRIVALELKTARGRVSQDQADWIDALCHCGIAARVARTEDFDEIVELLS